MANSIRASEVKDRVRIEYKQFKTEAMVVILLLILGYSGLLLLVGYALFYITGFALFPFYVTFKSIWNSDEEDKKEKRTLLKAIAFSFFIFLLLFLVLHIK